MEITKETKLSDLLVLFGRNKTGYIQSGTY